MRTFQPNVEGFALDNIRETDEYRFFEAILRKGRLAAAIVQVIASDYRVKFGPPNQFMGTVDDWRNSHEAALRNELRQAAIIHLGHGATEYDLILHLKGLDSKLV